MLRSRLPRDPFMVIIGIGRVCRHMRHPGVLPERDLLPPFIRTGVAQRAPDFDAYVFLLTPGGTDQPAQFLECRKRCVVRGIGQRHPAIAPFGGAFQGRIDMATEPDRQDLFQEMFIQLWRSYPSFRGEARFSTWLYRIALNTAISDFRKQSRRPASIDPDLLPTQLQDIQYSAEKEEQLQQLYAAIDRLTGLEKALTMLYLEDKSYQEMEEILGISQNNLRVKMNRIKDKLRKMTKEAVYGIG